MAHSRVGAALVDLVDRNGDDAERQRRRAGERDGPAAARDRGGRVVEAAAGPDAQRVGRATRPGEHPAGRAHGGERAVALGTVEAVAPGERGDGPPHVAREVVHGLAGDVVGVLLEPVRRVEQQRRPVARRAQHRPVHLDHRRSRLARAHDDQRAAAVHRMLVHESRPIRAATRSGCWAWRSWSPPGNVTSSASGRAPIASVTSPSGSRSAAPVTASSRHRQAIRG